MLLMGCGGSDSPTGSGSGNNLTDAAIVGKWELTSIHTQGWETDESGNHKDVNTTEAIPAGTEIAEYKSDKTFTQGTAAFSVTGTWSVKGDSLLTVIADFGGVTLAEHVVIDGKTATFTSHQVDSEEDITVTNTATKQ